MRACLTEQPAATRNCCNASTRWVRPWSNWRLRTKWDTESARKKTSAVRTITAENYETARFPTAAKRQGRSRLAWRPAFQRRLQAARHDKKKQQTTWSAFELV